VCGEPERQNTNLLVQVEENAVVYSEIIVTYANKRQDRHNLKLTASKQNKL
jgi:hypothetical protein